jgi:hypothetical protein
LIDEAARRGVRVKIGNPLGAFGAQARADGAQAVACAVCAQNGQAAKGGSGSGGQQAGSGTIVLGVTYTKPGGSADIIVGNASNIKTITHELVHAVSTADGDSKTEESIANLLGERVNAQINGGTARDFQTIFNATAPLYPELGVNNPIRNTLANLGITV